MKTHSFWIAATLSVASLSAQMTTFPIAVTPPSYNFGMVGVAVGQTLRVIATNVATGPTAVGAASPPCSVSIKFFDGNGNTAGTGGQMSSLSPGQSFGVDLPGPTSGRAEYRAQIQILPLTPTATPQAFPGFACTLLSTLQVYDTATGKTDIVLTGSQIQGFPVPLAIRSPNVAPEQ